MRIGIIVRIAFMGDIADKAALPRLDDNTGAPCFWPPGASAKVQT
jgi:hypothetical protein